MGVWLGLWVGKDGHNFDAERTALLQLLQGPQASSIFANVVGIHVSSEAIYRGDLTVLDAMYYRNIIKFEMEDNGWGHIPVVVADIVSS